MSSARVAVPLLVVFFLGACAATPKGDAPPQSDLTMREILAKSLYTRLGDAELALMGFDIAKSLAILDEVEAATKDWKDVTPREQIALGWLEAQAREIRFIALLFDEKDHSDKLKALLAADTDRLFERFAGDGTTTNSPACYQLYAISGRDADADRGVSRMLALLEGDAHAVKRFRVHVLAASTLAGMGMAESARVHLDRAAAFSSTLHVAKVEDLPAFGTFCVLPAILLARGDDFAAAGAIIDTRLNEVPEHVAKGRLQRYANALKELVDSWKAEQERYAKEPADLPKVEFETDKGNLEITLFEDDAPNTVASFVTLVEKGFYDGTPFHRVVPHFVVQGGDPSGRGNGGPGYSIKLEATRKHFRGTLGMARGADPDSAGSQFYFCLSATTTFHLNNGYAVFGRVSKGLDVMDALRLGGKIIKARLLCKRAHGYKVEKLPEKQ